MHKSLALVLVGAKELNKWVAVKHLKNDQLQGFDLIQFEDEGTLLVHHHSEEGILLKLTLKGYRQYKN